MLGLLLSLVLGLALRWVPDGDGARLWALALVPLSLGLALTVFSFDIPLLLVLRDPLVLLGLALLLVGLRRELQSPRGWLLSGCIMFASLVLNALFIAVWPLPAVRDAVRLAGVVLLCLACMSALRRLREPELRKVRRFLLGHFGLLASGCAVQLVWRMTLPAPVTSLPSQPGVAEVATGLLMLGLPPSLLLLLLVRMDLGLGRLATGDPLTGLLNFRGLEEAAGLTIAFARRVGRPVGLLLCGLDRRGPADPSLAEAEETAALKSFAGLLQQRFDGALLAGRDGREFAVLLPGAGPEEALREAETLLAAEPFACADETAVWRLSIGVHAEPASEAVWRLMRARAGAALHRARFLGPACVLADGDEVPAGEPPPLASSVGTALA